MDDLVLKIKKDTFERIIKIQYEKNLEANIEALKMLNDIVNTVKERLGYVPKECIKEKNGIVWNEKTQLHELDKEAIYKKTYERMIETNTFVIVEDE